MKTILFCLLTFLFGSFGLLASEANLLIPDLHAGGYHILGQTISS